MPGLDGPAPVLEGPTVLHEHPAVADQPPVAAVAGARPGAPGAPRRPGRRCGLRSSSERVSWISSIARSRNWRALGRAHGAQLVEALGVAHVPLGADRHGQGVAQASAPRVEHEGPAVGHQAAALALLLVLGALRRRCARRACRPARRPRRAGPPARSRGVLAGDGLHPRLDRGAPAGPAEPSPAQGGQRRGRRRSRASRPRRGSPRSRAARQPSAAERHRQAARADGVEQVGRVVGDQDDVREAAAAPRASSGGAGRPRGSRRRSAPWMIITRRRHHGRAASDLASAGVQVAQQDLLAPAASTSVRSRAWPVRSWRAVGVHQRPGRARGRRRACRCRRARSSSSCWGGCSSAERGAQDALGQRLAGEIGDHSRAPPRPSPRACTSSTRALAGHQPHPLGEARGQLAVAVGHPLPGSRRPRPRCGRAPRGARPAASRERRCRSPARGRAGSRPPRRG